MWCVFFVFSFKCGFSMRYFEISFLCKTHLLISKRTATEKNSRNYQIPVNKLKDFYKNLSILMTLQLQSLFSNTVEDYTNFLCNETTNSPEFQINVLFKNNKITFNPSYNDFKNKLLDVYENLIRAVQKIPKIESELWFQNFEEVDRVERFLKPEIIPQIIQSSLQKVQAKLENEWIVPELKIQDFDPFICLINGQSHIEVNKFLSDERPFEIFKSKVAYYRNLMNEIAVSCGHVISVGIFEIHREHFITNLMNKSQGIRDRFLAKVNDICQHACKCLNIEFQTMKDMLLKEPRNTAELVHLKEYSLNLGIEVLFQIEERLRKTMNYILFYSDYVPLTTSQIKQNSITFLWYRKINGILEENRNIIEKYTKIFQELLLSRIENFKIDLEKKEKDVEEFENYRDANELSHYLKKAETLYEILSMSEDKIAQFNEEEVAFGWIRTSYPKKNELVDKLIPYKKLYETCADYKNKYQLWTEADIGKFEPCDIEKDMRQFCNSFLDMSKQFSSNPAPYALTNTIRSEVEQFQKNLPIVRTLGNPCLKKRHWEKISEIVGFPLHTEENLTLAKILDYGLEEYVSKFEVVSDSATKENNLEIKLNEMISEWKDMKFNIKPYRATYVLVESEKIQVLLNDHIVKSQTMKTSPYIKPFETIIHSWEEKLVNLQKIIDIWLTVQNTWLYFEPIFAISDIQLYILEESKRFSSVDKIWRDIMKAVSLNITTFAVISIDKIFERLGKCESLLNVIQCGIGSYLETKRLIFPRFFFLSDKEILDIISSARDISQIQPLLKKCYEGIKELTFTNETIITALKSDIEEELLLTEQINTSSYKDLVEKWLADLECKTKDTIRKKIIQNLQKFKKYEYQNWVLSEIQQVICLIYNINFTSTVAEILSNTGALKECLSDCSKNIEEIIALLFTSLESKIHQHILASLLTYTIYHRDIIQYLLKNSEISDRQYDFESQLRFTIENENVLLRMNTCGITYGYEYVGNFIPLVITPVTQSCYRSFFIAFKYKCGAYLESPTGFGKSSIIKDFAVVFAKNCVILQCSKSIDPSIVENFVKGAICSNSWICFKDADFFNSECLKVMKYYCLLIQQAVLMKSNNSIKFCNMNLKLNENCLVLATVNREKHLRQSSNLSLSIKTFFRNVSFNKIDYEKILLPKLIFSKFKKFELLSKKLSAVLNFSTRLFSSCSYYHNDIRLMEKIISSMKNIKNLNPYLDEEIVLLQSLNLIYRPLLGPEDQIIFHFLLENIGQQTIDLSLLFDDNFKNVVQQACTTLNIIVDNTLLEKTFNLLNILNISIGTIIVGDAFVGKSSLIKVASLTLNLLQKNIPKNEIEIVIINPKSVTVNQLFGHRDECTKKWIDGIFTSQYRKFALSPTNNEKWIVFDGPINTCWVENLCSVLDKTQKLSLSSGELITLPSYVKLLFETMNIQDISLSMISRCCLLFLNHGGLIKWQYLIDSWINVLTKAIENEYKNYLKTTIIRICSVIFYLLDNMSENLMFNVSKNSMIRSLCNIMECFINDCLKEDCWKFLSNVDKYSYLENTFFFSCIWSLGAVLNDDGRIKFDVVLRALLSKEFPENVRQEFNIPENLCYAPSRFYTCYFPNSQTVFDYQYVAEGKGTWQFWTDNSVMSGSIPRDIQFNEIIVPTKTTIKNSYLISILMRYQKPTMLVGHPASGKSVDITYYFNNKLEKNIFKAIYLNFSVNMSGNSIQRIISNELHKRKRGVYGSPFGKRYILFFDDLHVTTIDNYEALSALELLRYFIEYNQWYNLEDASVIKLIDLQLLFAVTTDKYGNKRDVNPRFSRHFNVFFNDRLKDDDLTYIFSKVVLWHLDSRGFSKEFDPCISQIVNATLTIHNLVEKKLLPVPHKSHYIFNLRDFSRVFQGVILSVPEAVEDLCTMKRLWVHEVMRIYHDRIINKADSDWFINSLNSVITNQLQEDPRELMHHILSNNETEINKSTLEKLLFCDFINPKADVRNYAEVRQVEDLQPIVEGFLIEYNNVNKKPMNLHLLPNIIEHLSRICRAIKHSRGHALLLGEKSCGKQSLVKLAVHICEYEFFEVELAAYYSEVEWRKNIKNLLLSVYTNQHSAFLVNRIQNLKISMLNDICEILQAVNVLKLFTIDEKKEICEHMANIDDQRDKSAQTDKSEEALLNLFLERIQKQIHIILVFDVSLDKFRDYMYKFPQFIDYCTVNWFEHWSPDIRYTLTTKLLSDMNSECIDLQTIIETCEKIYKTTSQLSTKITSYYRTDLYFSQKTYIRFIEIFKEIYCNKLKQLNEKSNLYTTALQKLITIEQQIPVLEEEYKNLQPVIEEKRDKIEQLEKIVENQKEVETEEEIRMNGARSYVNSCEKKLNQSQREYDEKVADAETFWKTTIETVQLLTVGDLALLKTVKNPSRSIKIVVEALSYIKEIKTEKVQESGKISEDFWKPSIKSMNDPKFIDSLVNFNKSDVSARIIRILEEKILPNEDFDCNKIKNSYTAIETIYQWIMAVYKYNQITKVDSEWRLNLNQLEQEFITARANLATNEKHFEKIREKRIETFNTLKTEQEQVKLLEIKEAFCYKKKLKSEELIDALQQNVETWNKINNALRQISEKLIGDILLSAAIITYSPPLPCELRQTQIDEWYSLVKSSKLSCSDNFTVSMTLLEYSDVDYENIFDLFEDDFFNDNFVIIRNQNLHVLLFDPEGFASEWIKISEASNNLVMLNVFDSDFYRLIGEAISNGQPVLLENVDCSLEMILHPLLEMQNSRSTSGIIKLGEISVEYNPYFRLYISTNILNPQYLVDVFDKVTVVNCSASKKGLQNYFLHFIAKEDNIDLESENIQQKIQSKDLKKMTKEMEKRILTSLISEDYNILENENEVNLIINTISSINTNIKRITEIDNRLALIHSSLLASYTPVSQYLSNLFFLTKHVCNLRPIYHISLKWFTDLIKVVIDEINATGKPENICETLQQLFTKKFLFEVSDFLTKTDQLVFAYFLAANSFNRKNQISTEELYFFSNFINDKEENTLSFKTESWLNKGTQRKLKLLSELYDNFKDILAQVNNEKVKLDNDYIFPDSLLSNLNAFQKLLLTSCMFPENTVKSVISFVQNELGIEYADTNQHNLTAAYKKSTQFIPIVIYVDDSDPMKEIFKLAEEQGISWEKCIILTPFENGDKFLNILDLSEICDSWIIISDVSSYRDWFNKIEKIFNYRRSNLEEKLNFRLWIILNMNYSYPLHILSNKVITMYSSSKVRVTVDLLKNEIKNRLLNCEDKRNANEEYHILDNLIVFHTVLRATPYIFDWNNCYSFNEMDYLVAFQEICEIWNNKCYVKKEILITVLNKLLFHCCYACKIFDIPDRKYLKSLIKSFWNLETIHTIHQLSQSDHNSLPGKIKHFMDLDLLTFPSTYDLKDNLLKLKNKFHATQFFKQIALFNRNTQIYNSVNFESYQILEKIENIEKRTIKLVNKELFSKKYCCYKTILDTALTKEITYLNNTILDIKIRVTNLNKSLKGYFYFNEEMKSLFYDFQLSTDSDSNTTLQTSLFSENNLNLIEEKYCFLKEWFDDGLPTYLDLSLFEYPEQFLAYHVLQYCWNNKIPITEINFHKLQIIPENNEFLQSNYKISIKHMTIKNAIWRDKLGLSNSYIMNDCKMLPPLDLTAENRVSDVNAKVEFICPAYKMDNLVPTSFYQHKKFITEISIPIFSDNVSDLLRVEIIFSKYINDIIEDEKDD